MRKVYLLTVVILALAAVSASADIPLTGSLSWPNGIFATQDWASPSTSMAWLITAPSDGSGLWTYQYTLNVNRKAISHFIIELTPGMTNYDIYNVTGAADYCVDTYSSSSQGNSNPGLNTELFGVKFKNFFTDGDLNGNDETHVVVSFQTNHEPVYGDFYAKDGKTNSSDVYAYNAGIFNSDDTGTNKIVRPDGETVIPEASTLMLGAMGLLPFIAARNRFRK